MESINNSYNPRIDELRGIACIAVFLFHVIGLSDNLSILKKLTINFGLFGVSSFFILSGFLFTLIFLKKDGQINYFNYLYSRFLRIFPMVIFLLIFWNLQIFQPLKTIKSVLNIIIMNNESIMYGSPYFISKEILHFWTIFIDMFFYIIFPVLFFLLRKYFYILLSIMIFSILLYTKGYYFSYIGQLWLFIIGMLIAESFFFKKDLFITPYFINIFFIIISGITITISYFLHIEKLVIISLIIIFISSYLLWNNDNIFKRFFRFIGKISFSFYIIHLSVFYYVSLFINSKTSFLLYFLLSFFLTILFSILTYNLIEKPFMNLRKKY